MNRSSFPEKSKAADTPRVAAGNRSPSEDRTSNRHPRGKNSTGRWAVSLRVDLPFLTNAASLED